MISYYADVLPDGRVRGCFQCVSPPVEGWAPQIEGQMVPLDAPIDWRGPSDTSVLRWVDGTLTWLETASLDQVKAAKLSELAADFADRMNAVKSTYPPDEIQSWFKQEAEARAYAADNTAATPLLSAMAGARGITVADLAGRVIANADAWSATSGGIIGKRQAYEDAVTAATDIDTVRAIVWTD